ncbi:hypothetical protein Tco_0754600 [Tanacetum coccineum]
MHLPIPTKIQRKKSYFKRLVIWDHSSHGFVKGLARKSSECYRMLTDQVDLVNLEGHWLVPDVSKLLPLGGPPGDKGRRSALSISKLKAAKYLDFGLEELVPTLWIESEREYDISAAYGISH